VFVALNILTAACFLVLSGFFSGVETGIYVLDPLLYHVKLKQGDREARLIERLLRKKSQLVTGLLVGTNLSIFLATVYATKVTGYFCPGVSLATAALVTTVFTTAAGLIFAEMLPKNVYRKRANTLVYSSARAFYVSSWLFLPLVKALSVLTGGVNIVFGRRGTLESDFLTRKAVERHLTGESGRAALTKSQREMVRNIMQLPEKNLLSAMIPLRDVYLVSETTRREEVIELVRKKRFSRMPVYRDTRTNIVGVLNVFDLFYESRGTRFGIVSPWDHLIRPLPAISRSARIDEALVILREARQPMGLVVGPKKDAVGIVTIKDLLEEITGEIGAW
jgi:CBS domain containing-hemolysin-like protein